MPKLLSRVVVASVLGLALLSPAAAQVVYAHPSALDPFFSPYDESYGTSPAFEIAPTPYGQSVHVVERCQYPGGWNVTDFSRDLNGIPAGVDHTCPNAAVGGRVRARY